MSAINNPDHGSRRQEIHAALRDLAEDLLTENDDPFSDVQEGSMDMVRDLLTINLDDADAKTVELAQTVYYTIKDLREHIIASYGPPTVDISGMMSSTATKGE